MINHIFLLLTVLFEVYIFSDLIDKHLYSKRFKSNLLFIVVLLILCFVINELSMPILNCIVIPLFYFAYSCVCYNDKIWKYIFYVVLFYTIGICLEVMFELIFVLIEMYLPDFYNSQLNSDYFVSRWFIILLEKIVFFVIIQIINQVSSYEIKINNKMFYGFLILPFATVITFVSMICYINNAQEYYYANIFACLSGFALLFSNVYVFYLIKRYSVLTNKNLEMSNMAIKSNLEQKHYTIISEINDKHNRFLHDITKYFRAINSLALNNDTKEIINITNQIDETCKNIETRFFCSIPVINAILCDKKDIADRNNINLSVNVASDFELIRIDEIDFISALGNLADNALEAAKKSKERRVEINLFISNKRFLTIQVINSFEKTPEIKSGGFISSKTTNKPHGLGIKNTEIIANRYGGYLNIDIQNKIVVATMTLPVMTD